MVAAIPLTVCKARNSPPTGARFAGLRSHSSSSWLQALRCSRLSARNSSAYCERSMESAEDALDGLEDARRLERLHDEILRAGLDRFHHQGLLAHGAAHEDLRVGIILHDLAHRVDPPMSGITMSIVTRSGLSCRYFSTAWDPVSASPTTSKPACARMSLIIVRMKMASSQTRTVWLTHPP